jgi:hypothetical protein
MTSSRICTVVVCLDTGTGLQATLDALDVQTIREVAETVLVLGPDVVHAELDIAAAVTVIKLGEPAGWAAARNVGWRAATAPLVAFTESGCRPQEDWLARLVTSFAEHPDAAGVGGAITVSGIDSFVTRYLQRNNPDEPLEIDLIEKPGLLGRLGLYLRRCAGMDRVTGTRPVSSLPSANLAFRVSALHEVDGFDDRFQAGSDEEDLCRRLQVAADARSGVENRWVLWFSPTAVVDRPVDVNLAGTLKRSETNGQGNAQMFLGRAVKRPVVHPLPFVVLGLFGLALARRRVGPAVLGAALPPLLFSRWLRLANSEHNPEFLLYPYVELAHETFGNVGLTQALVSGWRHGDGPGPTRPVGRTERQASGSRD